VGIAGLIGKHPRNAGCLMRPSFNYPANAVREAKRQQNYGVKKPKGGILAVAVAKVQVWLGRSQ
jgi:hypothetical protein